MDPAKQRLLSLLDVDPDYAHLKAELLAGTPDPNVPLVIDPNKPQPLASLGYGHGHLVDANQTEVPAALGSFRGEVGKPVIDPKTGQKIWDPETKLVIPPTGADAPEAAFAVRAGPPGEWADGVWDGKKGTALDAAMEHALARAVAGDEVIASDVARPHGWPSDELGKVPKPNYPIDKMNVYPIDPSSPRLESVAAPQPEGLPGGGRPAVYPGGGPQVQLPAGTIPKGTKPAAGFHVYKPGRAGKILGGPIGKVDDVGDAASLGGLVLDKIRPGGGGGSGPLAAPGAVIPAPAAGQTPATERRVEPVNPDYEKPPGSPEELAQMRREIGAMLVSRDQADADAAAAQADQAETDRRADQLMSVASGVDGLDQRANAQASEVAATTAANTQQQDRQEEAGTAIGASASRLTGLATLELLLGGWAGVTGGLGWIVSLVSDSAGAKLYQLSGDATRFMGQLLEAKMLVSGQKDQHPLQKGRLAGAATALGTEANRTTATGTGIDKSGQQVVALGNQNSQDAAAAQAAEQRARQDATDADTAAADAQARHDQLAADLEAWAQRHREQRRIAIAQTCDRLMAEGYEVTNVPTS
jgi:hypothetical protein